MILWITLLVLSHGLIPSFTVNLIVEPGAIVAISPKISFE